MSIYLPYIWCRINALLKRHHEWEKLFLRNITIYIYRKDTTMGKTKFKPGGLFGNILITSEDGILNYRGAYGDRAMFSLADVQTVTLSPAGFGKSDVVIIGHGAELARIRKLPAKWAEKTMKFILQEVTPYKNSI